jgi:uroporphyrinogen-III decarboxylase
MFNPGANPMGLEFKEYFDDPDLMFDAQLQFQRWLRFNILSDYEGGLPEKWIIKMDFQNVYEAGFFGCPIEFINGQVPCTLPFFADAPEKVMVGGIPDPFSGLMARALYYYERFKERASRETFLGRPIEVTTNCTHTDGPFTVACNLFGADVVCLMMMEEPDRMHKLLDFVATACIERMSAWRKLCCEPALPSGFLYADDSLTLISTEMYREFVLPHHRRLCDTAAPSESRMIHLCGDSTRHFPTLRDELNIQTFDTGFPVDFGNLRKTLGPKVRIQGGPHVDMLLRGTPDSIRANVRWIMETGVLDGGMFVLRDGNNIAPGTPLENTEAMYYAGREFGALK